MLYRLFLKKKKIKSLKVSTKIPFEISTEKIIESPRTFNTNQIQNAVKNILISETGADSQDKLLTSCSEYILKDFFLYMHQTGIYNRQLKLWKAIGNVRELFSYYVENTFTKKLKPGLKLIDFSTGPKSVAICALIPEEDNKNFSSHLSLALGLNNSGKLKGIFYFTRNKPDDNLIKNFENATDQSDQISRYEAIIKGTNDVRLNIIVYKEENENYSFEHVLPSINLEVKDVRV